MMVDTIGLCVRNMSQKHFHLVEHLFNNFAGIRKYSGSVKLHVPPEGFDIDAKEVFSNLYQDFVNDDEGIVYYLKDVNFKSSHYDIKVVFNVKSDFIKMEFSVPKMLYGTNVLQLVPSPTIPKYFDWDDADWLSACNKSYDLLMRFIYDFLHEIFGGLYYDPCDVEINRLDLCFNQVFETNGIMKKYLGYIRQNKKKYSRSDTKAWRFENGNIQYANKEGGFKIYQKDLDFNKHDKKQLYKNPSYAVRSCIKDLSILASLSLRYEYTFRRAGISRIYKNNIFRKHCPIYKSESAYYKTVRAKKARFDRTGKIPLTTYEKEFFKYHRKLKESVTGFYLAVNERDNLLAAKTPVNFSKTIDDMVLRKALFSRELFTFCCMHLYDTFADFQVESRPPSLGIIDLIDKHNETCLKSERIPKTLKFYVKSKFTDDADYDERVFADVINDDVTDGFISSRTKYNYINHLKRIGISTKSAQDIDFHIPMDFERYHNFHVLHNDFQPLYELLNSVLDSTL